MRNHLLMKAESMSGGERRAHLCHRGSAFFRSSRNKTHDGVRGALAASPATHYGKLETDRCTGRPGHSLSIAELPGQKVMLRGNHDYWWTGLSKMKQATGNAFFFLQNNFYPVNTETAKLAICGSRAWLTPACEGYKPETDDSILRHEALRIRASLDAAKKEGYDEILLALPVMKSCGSELRWTLPKKKGTKKSCWLCIIRLFIRQKRTLFSNRLLTNIK